VRVLLKNESDVYNYLMVNNFHRRAASMG